MEQIKKQPNILYGVVLFMCLLPFVTPVTALLLGLFFSVIGWKNELVVQYAPFTLKAAIVFMGFGMNLVQVISASKSGFVDTAISVTGVMGMGILLGRLLKVDQQTTLLISAGTAICGGSAIAAIAPVLGAKSHQISFSLIVIFVLNALALIVFPAMGHYFHLTQTEFGYWAAIAIHDTSSVVGAGATYGPRALEVATTIKLVRTLWIIPLSVVLALLNNKEGSKKVNIPWFIGLFMVSMLLAWAFPQMQSTFDHLFWLGKRIMIVALFLIGSSISVAEARKAGVRSFALGVALWLLIGITSLWIFAQV